MRITNVNSKFPGSSHDCHIWNNSRVQDAVRHISDAHPDFFLIGDSGYPLRPWLLTPLQDPSPDTPEFRYNKAFKKARCTIERCNGLLKMRFRCLLKHRVLHYAPNVCAKIINACVVLHNICLENNIPNPDGLDYENGDLGIYGPMQHIENFTSGNNTQNAELIRGRNVQRNIIRNYFN
ncbi:putative nuclease HARBI1 [Coccinella septempunctata]|uniref:putative nuclease HARBI1 n=1 Tax=Coccinella septempunctata TaxID=41139 RepID=UPI001D07260A|nr:putative nuclease HARBI1 [Coccinella septempunctata]